MLRGFRAVIPEGLWVVLEAAHTNGGLSVQSDFSRHHSLEVALAASLGWLTTIATDGQTYGRRWLITVPGLEALTNKEHLK